MAIHIDNWISNSEPDYYTMFIKAWIPFNAWYVDKYKTTEDKKALKEIKETKNEFRNRIETLLTNSDKEAKKFREELAHLQKELVDKHISNYGKPLSFKSIQFDEYFPEIITKKVDNIFYKITPNKETGFHCIITSENPKQDYMDRKINPYSTETLKLDNQYISLPEGMQSIILGLYKEVDPKNRLNLIKEYNSLDSLCLDVDLKICLKDDKVLIAQALIQILYELRCLLFHGIINPNSNNKSVYKHAYYILNQIIKSLN